MIKEVRLFYNSTTNDLYAMDTGTYEVRRVVLKEDGPVLEGQTLGGFDRMEPDIKVDVLPRY